MKRKDEIVARGFTLVELLVVIGIIALMIGLLLPALGQARGAAQLTRNLVNLRTLMQGVEMYTIDHEAFFPHKLPSGEVHQRWQRPGARFQWMLGEYIDPPFSPRNEAERQMMLTSNDLPRIDNDAFRDPIHQDEDFRSHQTGNLQFLRNNSYGYNYQYLGNSRNHPDGRPYRYPVRRASIQSPAFTVCLADSDGAQPIRLEFGAREHAYTLDPPTLDVDRTRTSEWGHSSGQVVASVRHNGRVSVAFLDYSVRQATLTELGYEVEDEESGLIRPNAGSNALWNGLGYDPRVDAGAN